MEISNHILDYPLELVSLFLLSLFGLATIFLNQDLFP